MRLIYIEWLDACEHRGDGLSPNDVATGLLLHSAGLFVKETKSVLSFGVDYDPDSGKFRSVHDVPKNLIRKRVEVKIIEKTSK